MYHVLKRRKERQNESAYASLIASPQDLLADDVLVLPANAELAVSSTLASPEGDFTLTYNGREITAVTEAGQIKRIGWFEKGKSLDFNLAGSGIYKVYLFKNNGKLETIAIGDYT